MQERTGQAPPLSHQDPMASSYKMTQRRKREWMTIYRAPALCCGLLVIPFHPHKNHATYSERFSNLPTVTQLASGDRTGTQSSRPQDLCVFRFTTLPEIKSISIVGLIRDGSLIAILARKNFMSSTLFLRCSPEFGYDPDHLKSPWKTLLVQDWALHQNP